MQFLEKCAIEIAIFEREANLPGTSLEVTSNQPIMFPPTIGFELDSGILVLE